MHPIRLSSVVLPLPEGPATVVNSPFSKERSTPRSAFTVVVPSGYSLVTARSSTMGFIRGSSGAGYSVRQGVLTAQTGSVNGWMRSEPNGIRRSSVQARASRNHCRNCAGSRWRVACTSGYPADWSENDRCHRRLPGVAVRLRSFEKWRRYWNERDPVLRAVGQPLHGEPPRRGDSARDAPCGSKEGRRNQT